MNDIIISGSMIESIMNAIGDKLEELNFKTTDLDTMFSDVQALAIAIASKNHSLIYGSFEYMRSAKGFKNPYVTTEMWRELYRWIHQKYIYKEEL